MNPDQTNTKAVGPFPVLAGEDLTAARSRLCVLTHDTGVPEIKLPTADTDDAIFQVQEGVADGALDSAERFAPHREFRVPLKGTCNPATRLVLADAGTPADKGKLRALPVSAGTYTVRAIAREAGVDGQHVLVEPISPIVVVVGATLTDAPAAYANATSTNGVAAAASASIADLAAEAEKIGDDARAALAGVTALRTALITAGLLADPT